MARPRSVVPRYCHHKPTGRAYVRVDGRFKYLGPHGTPASREQYARFVREYESAGKAAAAKVVVEAADPATTTVASVLAEFWAHAKTAYPYDPSYDGRRPPGEIGLYFDVMKPVLKLYGSTPAVEFTPNALRLVREEMIALGWCRNVVNRQTVRVRTMFKWAVDRELLPGEVSARLKAVPGLRRKHPGVRNTPRVRPVTAAVLDATLAVAPPRLAAMIKLQLLSGMRSGNLCDLRTSDVDTTGGDDGTGAWVYRPRTHKTEHHDHELAIRLGPKARAVLGPYLRPDAPEAFVFSPAQEMAEVRAARSAARTTPLSCGNRPGTKAKRAPKKTAGDRYTPGSYAAAVKRACDRADAAARTARADAGLKVVDGERLVPRWNPHRLRHNRGTVVRAKHGTDGVLAALGQKTAAMADRYAEIEDEKAERIAAELG